MLSFKKALIIGTYWALVSFRLKGVVRLAPHACFFSLLFPYLLQICTKSFEILEDYFLYLEACLI